MRNKIVIFGTMLLMLSSLGLTAQNKFQLSLGTSIGLANIKNNSPSFNRWYFKDGPTFQYGPYLGGSYAINERWFLRTNFSFFKRSASGLKVKDNFSDPAAIALSVFITTDPSFSYFGTYENWFLDVPLMVAFSPFQNKIRKRYSIRMAVGPNFLFNLKRLQTLTPLTNTVNPIRETEYNRLRLQTGAVFSLGLNREIAGRYGIAIEILGKAYDFYDAEHYFGANLGGWISF